MKLKQLKGMDFSEDKIARAVKDKKALALVLQYGFGCKLACQMCYASKGEEIKKFKQKSSSSSMLSLYDYMELIKDAKKAGIEAVHVSGEGDPMESMEFFDLIELIREHELQPVVYSHGLDVNRGVAKFFRKLGVSFIGKCHSFESRINDELVGKELYSYMRAGDPAVPAHIKYLMDEGMHLKNMLGVNCIINSKNFGEVPAMWRWMRKNLIVPMMEFVVPSGFALDHPELDISEDKRKFIHEQIYNLDRGLGIDYEFSMGPYPGDRKCDSRPLLMIDLFGNARVCASSYVPFGNVRESSLPELVAKHYEIEEVLDRKHKNNGVYCECSKYCESQQCKK